MSPKVCKCKATAAGGGGNAALIAARRAAPAATGARRTRTCSAVLVRHDSGAQPARLGAAPLLFTLATCGSAMALIDTALLRGAVRAAAPLRCCCAPARRGLAPLMLATCILVC